MAVSQLLARRRVVLTVALCAVMTGPAAAQSAAQCDEIVLHNGKIVTMDPRGTIATSVTVRSGRIAAVATARGIPRHSDCARLIDLRGRTVVPGLIDNHAHIVAVGLRPGHDTRLEAAASIADVQAALRRRAADVPRGQWITAIGGWHPNQLAEKRLPTGAELDAATTTHPVLVCLAFAGPSATNGLGRAFLASKGVAVDAEGRIAAAAQSLAALNALRAIQTFEDQKRGTREALEYAAGFGVTTHMDNGGGWPPLANAAGVAQIGNGASNEMDPFVGYDPAAALNRSGSLPARLRLFFSSRDLTPELRFLSQRLNNQIPGLGDDWLKVGGVGEWITSWTLTAGAAPPHYAPAVRMVATRGWSYQQHTSNLEDEVAITDVWEKVNAEVPLAPLRWNLAHVPGLDRKTLDRLRAVGVGIGVGGNRYLNGTAGTPGPPFRMIVDSGIHVGYGSDGGNVAPINPWIHVYYMVTGRNSAGDPIEPGQQLTRMEALRLYTSSNAWFTAEEASLGSIEAGKFADLAVLSADVLDPARVPDPAIKGIRSVLTVVGGRIVYEEKPETTKGATR